MKKWIARCYVSYLIDEEGRVIGKTEASIDGVFKAFHGGVKIGEYIDGDKAKIAVEKKGFADGINSTHIGGPVEVGND